MLGAHMGKQGDFIVKTLTAEGTVEGFLNRMNAFMNFERGSSSKTLPTHFTNVRPIYKVYTAHMFVQDN